MPRIDTIKIGVFWLAFTVNDLHQYGTPRVGFTEDHARNRVIKRLA